MKRLIFLVFIGMIYCNEKSSNKSEGRGEPLDICVTRVDINYYEDDTLNRTRPYVIPMIYFHFRAINYSDSTQSLVINSHSDNWEPEKLVLRFKYADKLDSTRVTDFGSPQVFKILPNDTTFFIINTFVNDLLNSQYENPYQLMKEIALSADFYYSPNLWDTLLIIKGEVIHTPLNIKYCKEHLVNFRDPNDTTIE